MQKTADASLDDRVVSKFDPDSFAIAHFKSGKTMSNVGRAELRAMFGSPFVNMSLQISVSLIRHVDGATPKTLEQPPNFTST